MKNIVIKGLVIILALSVYFNVSQIFQMKTLNNTQDALQENITNLEELQQDLLDQIENLSNQEVIDDTETCNKLYEITIQVVSLGDDFDQSYVHCTNKVYLGDALDEMITELEVFYDPSYSKDYLYGRLVVSFYGLTKEFEEYYEITINGTRAEVGLDYIEIEDATSYEFTLVRWD